MDVKNQSVVITGGGSGLGAGAARLFVEQGAKVALLDRNPEPARALADELNCLAIQCDVADETSVLSALEQATRANGAPRIFINCAGIDITGRIATRGGGPQPLDALGSQIAVNLTGTFNVCRLGADRVRQLEPLDAEEQGVIVNVASAAGLDGPRGQTAYAATKAAVIGMTLPMARDLAGYGIRVVTIAPGCSTRHWRRKFCAVTPKLPLTLCPSPSVPANRRSSASWPCRFAKTPCSMAR